MNFIMKSDTEKELKCKAIPLNCYVNVSFASMRSTKTTYNNNVTKPNSEKNLYKSLAFSLPMKRV